MNNRMEIILEAHSCNEWLARVCIAAFLAPLNPTLEELADVKTAVSEAVTNAIIHGYEETCQEISSDQESLRIQIVCEIRETLFTVMVRDWGCGIENISQAMEPMYTSKPELERSGMGFSFMEAFMDELQVESAAGEGTCVTMKKSFREKPRDDA